MKHLSGRVFRLPLTVYGVLRRFGVLGFYSLCLTDVSRAQESAIAYRYPDGVGGPVLSSTLQERDQFRVLERLVREQLSENNPEVAWDQVRDYFHLHGNADEIDLKVARYLAFVGEKVKRSSGSVEEVEKISALVRDRLIEDLSAQRVGETDPGLRAAKMAVLARIYDRLLDRRDQAEILYEASDALDPSNRYAAWSLRRLLKAEGKDGASAVGRSAASGSAVRRSAVNAELRAVLGERATNE